MIHIAAMVVWPLVVRQLCIAIKEARFKIRYFILLRVVRISIMRLLYRMIFQGAERLYSK